MTMAAAKRVVVNRIDVLSMAKVQGVLMFIFGAIIGIMFMAVATFGSGFFEGSGTAFLISAFGFLIGMPVGYGLMGFVSGAVIAFVYNIIARWIGGVRIELG